MKKVIIPNVYKTFVWNVGYQVVAFALRYIAENLTGLPIPAEYASLLGLILTAISKAISNLKK